MLWSCTQTSTLQKVQTPTNIDSNEQAYVLAKQGRNLAHEQAHPISYYLQRDGWYRTQETSYKGPIIHLDKHILKCAKRRNLAAIANQTYQPSKWLENHNIDKALSNEFGEKTPQ